MTIIFLTGLLVLVVLFVLWFSGVLHTILEVLSTLFGIGLAWVFDPRVPTGRLAEALNYRGFWQKEGVIETKGHLYAALELVPIPSDGYDTSDWNQLFRQLNALVTNLPVGTIIHFDSEVADDDLGAQDVFKKSADAAPLDDLKLLVQGRARHLQMLQSAGRLKNTRVFCFIGRPFKSNPLKISLKSILFPDEFQSREYHAFKSTADEVLRIQRQFLQTYTSFGGSGKVISPQEVFERIFAKLNPRLKHRLAAKNRPTNSVPKRLADYHQIKPEDVSPCEFFADSPRETLALSDFDFKQEYFEVDGVPTIVLSLNTLPSASTLGMIENLTRRSVFGFPISFSSTIQIEDQAAWEKHFTTIYRYLDEDLRMGSDVATRLQKQLQIEDIEDFRTRLRVANDRICLFGFNLTFQASDLEQIRQRREAVMNFLSEIDGFQLAYEKHLPFPQFLQTLPCEDVTKDNHRKPFLVRAALGLVPVTGGNPGIAQKESLSVFTRADGGVFRWNPQAAHFASGMAGVVGRTGVGKSVLLNRLRTDALLEGRHLVTIDFDASGESLVHLTNGNIVDFRHGGIGFFDIRPKEGELLGDDQLDENGIPKGRFEEVCMLLEKLSLSPSSSMTDDLEPEESTFIREKTYQTYQTLRNRIPKMDDFLLTFENCRQNERPIAMKLTDRLRKFTSTGFLGDLLNTEEVALQPSGRYTVFDFQHVQNDPQLAFVATLMVKMYMRRFLSQGTSVKKYFDIDEVKTIAENPLLAALFSMIFSTARKRNCYCIAATQSPSHFMSPQLRDIRDNLEVFWVLPVSDSSHVAEAFRFTPGVTQLVESVSKEGVGIDYRDIALVYPKGVVRLRHRMNVLDRRLLAQRGKSLPSEGEVLDFLAELQDREVPVISPALEKALKLGEE